MLEANGRCSMINEEVVRHWAIASYPCKSGNGNLHTDGGRLWSYNLLIGKTELGSKIVLDYMAPNNFVSNTTSHHVSLAKRWADKIEEPI